MMFYIIILISHFIDKQEDQVKYYSLGIDEFLKINLHQTFLLVIENYFDFILENDGVSSSSRSHWVNSNELIQISPKYYVKYIYFWIAYIPVDCNVIYWSLLNKHSISLSIEEPNSGFLKWDSSTSMVFLTTSRLKYKLTYSTSPGHLIKVYGPEKNQILSTLSTNSVLVTSEAFFENKNLVFHITNDTFGVSKLFKVDVSPIEEENNHNCLYFILIDIISISVLGFLGCFWKYFSSLIRCPSCHCYKNDLEYSEKSNITDIEKNNVEIVNI